MSKLDLYFKIAESTVSDDGVFAKLSPESKQQIKDLFIELISDTDLGVDNIEVLRKKVSEL